MQFSENSSVSGMVDRRVLASEPCILDYGGVCVLFFILSQVLSSSCSPFIFVARPSPEAVIFLMHLNCLYRFPVKLIDPGTCQSLVVCLLLFYFFLFLNPVSCVLNDFDAEKTKKQKLEEAFRKFFVKNYLSESVDSKH